MISKILHELQKKYESSVDLMADAEDKNMKSFGSCYLGRSQAYKDAIELVNRTVKEQNEEAIKELLALEAQEQQENQETQKCQSTTES